MSDIIDPGLLEPPNLFNEKVTFAEEEVGIDKLVKNPFVYLNALLVLLNTEAISNFNLINKLILKLNELLPSDWNSTSKTALDVLVLASIGLVGVTVAADMEKKAIIKVGKFLADL